jgi:outer membrane receptor protein involved in Fe transport
MRILFFITLLVFCSSFCHAQVRVVGVIKDSLSGGPLPKAVVRLKGTKSFTALTDSAGHFGMSGVLTGTYSLTIDYVGYTSFKLPGLAVDRSDLDLGAVSLSPGTVELQKAVVTASKPLLETKVDRIVYNVDRDVTSQGGVATDVLRKVPQVSVDASGNVELLGNPSILFLINGKRSTIFGNSVVDALNSIPASQIQSIEVMSSPGAKYDATGTGGVINIILKKSKTEGFSGVVNATAGTRQENGSVNLTYKKNNLTVSGYFSGSDQLKVSTRTTNQRNSIDTASGATYFLGEHGNSDFNRYGYRTGLNADWDLSPKDNLAFSFAFNQFGNTTNGLFNQENTGMDAVGGKLFDVLNWRKAKNTIRNNTTDLGVDYTRKFRREKEQLTFSFLYSAGQDNTGYSQSQRYIANDSIFAGSTSSNPGKDRLTSIGLDYAYPLSKNFVLESGARTEIESLISNANVFTFDAPSYAYLYDNFQSYASTFRRSVYAGYFSASFKALHWVDVIAGVREEYTVNKAFYSNAGHVSIPNYNNLAPSLTVSHNFAGGQTLKFSYAYRLERPEYRDLNPFLNLADPQNITTGNPNIKPEIGHDFQLGYNFSIDRDNSLNLVLLYTHNNPDIKSFTTFYPSFAVGDSTYYNVNVTRRDNIASEDRWGLVLGGSFVPFGKLTLRPGLQLYDRITNNIYSIPQRITGFEYRWSFNANYAFAHGLIVEGFGNYRSGIKWQGRTPGFFTYTLALRQQLWGGKGSFGLVAVNAFANYLNQHSVVEGVGFHTDNLLEIPYRSFGVNFVYKFGGFKIKAKEDENLLGKPPVEN